MAAIPEDAKHLLEGKHFAHVATVNSDGTPQVSAVWIGTDDDLVTFNTVEGRVKTKNMHANPAVALSVTNEENPYENLIIQGKVVEMTPEGADDDIDALAKRYLDADSYPFRQPGEERVIVKIEPLRAR